MAGVSTGSKPYGPNTSAATRCMRCHARISRPIRSLVPSAFCACMACLPIVNRPARRVNLPEKLARATVSCYSGTYYMGASFPSQTEPVRKGNLDISWQWAAMAESE